MLILFPQHWNYKFKYNFFTFSLKLVIFLNHESIANVRWIERLPNLTWYPYLDTPTSSHLKSPQVTPSHPKLPQVTPSCHMYIAICVKQTSLDKILSMLCKPSKVHFQNLLCGGESIHMFDYYANCMFSVWMKKTINNYISKNGWLKKHFAEIFFLY